MQGLVLNPVRMAGWRPAISQSVTASQASPPGAMLPSTPVPFIDSALVAAAFDAAGAVASGILGYGAASRKNKLSYVFWAAAGILAVKGIADLYDVRRR